MCAGLAVHAHLARNHSHGGTYQGHVSGRQQILYFGDHRDSESLVRCYNQFCTFPLSRMSFATAMWSLQLCVYGEQGKSGCRCALPPHREHDERPPGGPGLVLLRGGQRMPRAVQLLELAGALRSGQEGTRRLLLTRACPARGKRSPLAPKRRHSMVLVSLEFLAVCAK